MTLWMYIAKSWSPTLSNSKPERSRKRRTRMVVLGDRHFSVLASLIPVASNLAMTPLLTRTLGTTEFGLWASLVAVLGSVQLVDLGVGSSLFRFMAVAQKRDGRSGCARYVAAAVLYYFVFAALCLLVLLPWHATLYAFISARTSSPDQTVLVFLCLIALTPIGNAFLTALQAVGDFRQTASVIFASQLAYAGIVLVTSIALHLTIAQVLIAQAIQLFIVICYAAIRLPIWKIDGWLTRKEIGQFGTFSTRIWLTNLSGIPVLQLPIIAVTAIASPTAAGVFGLAAMVALALRNLPLMSVAPIVRSLTGTKQNIIVQSTQADKSWRKTLWVYAVLGIVGIVVGVPVLGGPEYSGAIAPAILLFSGYIIQLNGAIATITARQLGLTRVEWQASAIGGAIHLALLWPSISVMGIYGPGTVLIISQSVTLLLVRRQFRSFLRAEVPAIPIS